ncbi:MAG: ATP-dependent Clp protease ATP-binding subunit ClpC [Chlamydiales bacterium]|jgi:ATP-dependent Clp protease ATP-binding subunit ClpC
MTFVTRYQERTMGSMDLGFDSDGDSVDSDSDYEDMETTNVGSERPQRRSKRLALVKVAQQAIAVEESDSESELEEPPLKRLRRNDNSKAVTARGRKGPLARESFGKFHIFSDLTQQLKQTPSSEVIGRDLEVREVIRILAHPGKANFPLLVGAQGVGKSSIVEKLVQLIDKGDVPPNLQKRNLIVLDGTKLVATQMGSGAFGGLGEDLRNFIERDLKRVENPILFIKDIDKLCSIENVPEYLASSLGGRVPCIASISGSEVYDAVEKSGKRFLNQLFSTVEVAECSENEAVEIIKQKMAQNPDPNKMEVTAEAIQFAVKLSMIHIKEQHLPKKAMNLLHQATQEVLLSKLESASVASSTPVKKGGGRKRGRAAAKPAAPAAPVVDTESVAKVMSQKTGIPSDHLIFSEAEFLDTMKERLLENIVGQDEAVNTVFKAVERYTMGFSDPNKPWGVFLFAGPTGVGKTELGKLIAKELFHDRSGIIRLDMSEYAESHSISKLIGAPPGYEGHESGGQLCKALQRKPHSVVLLDEIEKAHPDVVRTFLQVFDDGRLTDGQGRTIDCTHALFIMTSNLGAREMMGLSKNGNISVKDIKSCVEPLIIEHLSPELYNRLSAVIPFRCLNKSEYPRVIRVHLNRIKERVKTGNSIDLVWSEDVVTYFSQKDYDPKLGVRALCRVIDQEVTTSLSEAAKSGQIYRGDKVFIDTHRKQLFARAQR